MIAGYEGLELRYGDLHNHCDLSYGRGSATEALANARLQLDFVSLTVHGAWPDVPRSDPALGYLVDYHDRGFVKASEMWDDYLAFMSAADQPGEFLAVPSFEWHSINFGDHCVYFRNDDAAKIVDSPDLKSLREAVNRMDRDAIIVPHHIAYEHGYRGIDWQSFDPSKSPIAEIISFHGSAESCDGDVPYLHAMGPRDEAGTARHGWRMGHRFGVIGSTDHHNAGPGSYGFGKMAAWLPELTRAGLWNAMNQRRTYAVSGDRIALAFTVNGAAMGDVTPHADDREIEVAVTGGDSIDYVELLHDEQIVHRQSIFPSQALAGRAKVHVEVGWGEASSTIPWEVELRVKDGNLLDVEPRFRGVFPSGAPALNDGESYAPHSLQVSGNEVRFKTRTIPNPYSSLAATEGLCLELDFDTATSLEVIANGRRAEFRLYQLVEGSRGFHLGGFVSPAVRIRRAICEPEFTSNFTFRHRPAEAQTDSYRVRVRQRNSQWAWSSPVWVEHSSPGKE